MSLIADGRWLFEQVYKTSIFDVGPTVCLER